MTAPKARATGRPQSLTQGDLLGMPNPGAVREITQNRHGHNHGTSVEGYPDVASLRADQRRKAESITIPEVTLVAWYARQVAALEAAAGELERKVVGNKAALTDPEDRRWPLVWGLQAKLAYLCGSPELVGTLPLLRERGHCLICPNHGIEGVSEEDWGSVNPSGISGSHLYEVLSLRGVVTGEGPFAWERYCVECGKGAWEAEARRLTAMWARPVKGGIR